MNKKMNAYLNIEEAVSSGCNFEKLWYERSIMVITMIRDGKLNQDQANKLLLEIRGNLNWIKLNLNVELGTEHRSTLEKIFDSSTELILGYIEDLDSGYLDIVIESLKVISQPYYR